MYFVIPFPFSSDLHDTIPTSKSRLILLTMIGACIDSVDSVHDHY